MGRHASLPAATTWGAIAVLAATAWIGYAQTRDEEPDVEALIRQRQVLTAELEAARTERVDALDGADPVAETESATHLATVASAVLNLERQIRQATR